MAARTGASAVTFGPSLRARAFIVVSVAFSIALPALLLAVFRAEAADEETAVFLGADQMADDARRLQLAIEEVRSAVWQLEAAPSIDSNRAADRALDSLSRVILDVEAGLTEALAQEVLAGSMSTWTTEQGDGLLLEPEDPARRFREATGRVRRAVDPLLSTRQPQARRSKPDPARLRDARAALDTAAGYARQLAASARELTQDRADRAKGALSAAGRDQLVLFLLTLFALPVVAGFGPAWMVQPVLRLKSLAVLIGSGRSGPGGQRQIRATGDDEVAEVTRAIGKALSNLEENDRLKTGKIFESRKLLRKVLARIDEPVLIVGRGGTLDYANPGAAQLLGDEEHHLEGRPLDELVFSPGLIEAVEKARTGDVEEEGVSCTLEAADGRVEQVRAVLGGVQDGRGRVTRVVVVLHP